MPFERTVINFNEILALKKLSREFPTWTYLRINDFSCAHWHSPLWSFKLHVKYVHSTFLAKRLLISESQGTVRISAYFVWKEKTRYIKLIFAKWFMIHITGKLNKMFKLISRNASDYKIRSSLSSRIFLEYNSQYFLPGYFLESIKYGKQCGLCIDSVMKISS